MLTIVVVFSLLMCVLNWGLFVLITFMHDLPELKALIEALKSPSPPPAGGMGVTVTHAAVDPTKLASVTGTLAGAFKKAGPAPTAAALSVFFLLAALIAAGVDKF